MSKNNTSTVKVNKSAWIRSQPATLSAKDVVAKAKAENITLTVAQVYTARSTAKSADAKLKGRPGPKPVPAVSEEHESFFRKFVLHTLGRSRAQEILNELASIGL